MNLHGLTLLIPEKADSERNAVAQIWKSRGGEVLSLGKFWEPPLLEPATVRVYGNDTFCLVLAQKLGLDLKEPPEELLCGLPVEYLSREIKAISLIEIETETFPLFCKSAAPKLFQAAVYTSAKDVQTECKDLEDTTRVLVSEIVKVNCEARCFVLDGHVLDCAIYEGNESNRESAIEFANKAAASLVLPETCVMDIGYFQGKGWGIVEFNASWGAGLNSCDPEKVYPAIERATRAACT